MSELIRLRSVTTVRADRAAAAAGAGWPWPDRTLLGTLGAEDRAALFRLGVSRSSVRNEPLVSEGDETRDVFVLLSGCAKASGSSADGREVLLAILVGGDMVGEVATLDDEPRLSAVVAATEGAALVLPQARFLQFHASRPEVALAISRSLAAKLRLVTRHRLDVTGGPALRRLARTLEYLVESCSTSCGEGFRIDVPLSQTELASLIGASLPALYRATGALRARGVLATHYREQIITGLAAVLLGGSAASRAAASAHGTGHAMSSMSTSCSTSQELPSSQPSSH